MDSILIYRIKSGNQKAIEHFIKKYYPDIYKYCYRRTSNKEISEDITQETFEKFFRNLDTYQHKGKIKNYLYVISGNLCKNQYKKKTYESIENIDDRLEDNKEVAISYIDDKLTVDEAVDLLPEELKEVVLLYFFQDMKIREIAEILNIKVSLVKYRMKKGKEKLQEILKKEDFGV